MRDKSVTDLDLSTGLAPDTPMTPSDLHKRVPRVDAAPDLP